MARHTFRDNVRSLVIQRYLVSIHCSSSLSGINSLAFSICLGCHLLVEMNQVCPAGSSLEERHTTYWRDFNSRLAWELP